MGRGRFEFGAQATRACQFLVISVIVRSPYQGHLLKNFHSRIPCPCALSSFLFILYPPREPTKGLQNLSLEKTKLRVENGNAQAQQNVFFFLDWFIKIFPFYLVSKCIHDWNWDGNREVSFWEDVKSLSDNKVGEYVCVSCPTINASRCYI